MLRTAINEAAERIVEAQEHLQKAQRVEEIEEISRCLSVLRQVQQTLWSVDAMLVDKV